jgi:hypothetical protein
MKLFSLDASASLKGLKASIKFCMRKIPSKVFLRKVDYNDDIPRDYFWGPSQSFVLDLRTKKLRGVNAQLKKHSADERQFPPHLLTPQSISLSFPMNHSIFVIIMLMLSSCSVENYDEKF